MSVRILRGQAAHCGPTRQEPMMSNRRTSLYTFRTPLMTMTAARLRAAGIPIQDRGERSVSWRAADDTAARYTRKNVIGNLDGTLTTGLGVHRREVSP